VWADERLSRFVPRRLLDARSRRRTLIPDEELNHLAVARMAKQLADRGVSIQLGAHGQREGLAAHWELWNFVLGGMRPLEALRVGTLNGARYLGLERDLGSLEPGKLGDLLVLDEDPLTDIHHSRSVRFTVLGGRVYDSATMNELWPTRVTRPPLYFELDGAQTWPTGAAAASTDD
jgi:imidazolonepropionase-like amidohydrolase